MKKNNQNQLYVMFGPPGSGKTVLASYLSRQLRINSISWGNICRDKKYRQKYLEEFVLIYSKKTNRKNRAKLIAGIIDNEINEMCSGANNHNLIIDGFPRGIEEAKHLIKIIHKYNYKIRALININPSLENAYKRMSSRYFCKQCKKYYDELMPPKIMGKCDDDYFDLEKMVVLRDDLKNEFEEYSKESENMINFLKPHSSSYFDVSGDDEEILIFSNILMKLRDNVKNDHIFFEKRTQSLLQTNYGEFLMISYQSKIDYSCHLALVKGDVKNREGVLLRVHSSCITGDIFKSSKCDCGEQLDASMKLISKKNNGVIIYLFQEGRGINIINKIKAYDFQIKGFDTVEANEQLGLPAEMRDYIPVENIIRDLGIKSINLITNNPDKVNKITDLGVVVQEQVPLEIKPNTHNRKYLYTKKTKMNHKLRKYI